MEFEKYIMMYEIDEYDGQINIFNEDFVEANRNKAFLKIRNKKTPLTSVVEVKKPEKNLMKIQALFMKNLSNKSFMFKNCNSLVELSIENYNKYLSNISFDDVIGNIGDEIYYENKESENLLNNMVDSNSNENL